ncbi:TetR family transcriptional regulator [Halopolyspora algeriensis]|uniref:TetR family transcriptional regulator n=1 Tax=Halopolyspora algeriensis TaxID=1500506 RepID=A0A368VVV3_9ACTN|nr:TetR family transcriptional regulator [Halopolyspora algeriensis]RCW46234.1 TetR family transcriptional regulator [Halopolyspora algeriensis]TQM55637.1 TetR family transcriptional regulator [Halopolyspora algeriensis]
MPSTTRPYRGLSAEQRKAQRRARLLEAGLDLLGTAGCERATMTAICSRAKLTERYFYESFRSREQLLLAVVDQVADEVRSTVLAAVETAPDEPHARARVAISAFVDLLTADPRKGRAAIVESAAAETLRPRRHELLREFADLIVTQARSLYGTAAHAPPRDEINALLFVGGLAELLTAWLGNEIVATPADIIEAGTEQLAAALHR